MKFNRLLKNIILENSRAEILFDNLTKPTTNKEGKKQSANMSENEFFHLLFSDPTTIFGGESLSKIKDPDPEKVVAWVENKVQNANEKQLSQIKAGKYLNWLIKQFVIPSQNLPKEEKKEFQRVFFEDLYKTSLDLIKFERFKSKIPQDKRDINKLTIDDVYDLTKDFDLRQATTTKAERRSADVHPGAELVYDGDNWRVVRISEDSPIGKEAACYYGGNQQATRWCTSAPGLTYFESHLKQGPLYVIYNPNDPDLYPGSNLPKERYQFHFTSNPQYKDKDNRDVDVYELLNGKMSELKDIFKPFFAQGLTTKGNLVIDSFKSGNVGRFVSLYGLDDLFETLPENLQEIQINNSDTKSTFKIPETILRFKNLETLLLQNCITELPEFICSLEQLRFLALMNNENLRRIPDCIAHMPKLEFLNIRNSKNVELPQELLDNPQNEVLPGMWNLKEL